MENVVIYSGHLEYFMTNGYILGHLVILPGLPFGILLSALVYCTKKNLATLTEGKT
jgi:hypothetical protein